MFVFNCLYCLYIVKEVNYDCMSLTTNKATRQQFNTDADGFCYFGV